MTKHGDGEKRPCLETDTLVFLSNLFSTLASNCLALHVLKNCVHATCKSAPSFTLPHSHKGMDMRRMPSSLPYSLHTYAILVTVHSLQFFSLPLCCVLVTKPTDLEAVTCNTEGSIGCWLEAHTHVHTPSHTYTHKHKQGNVPLFTFIWSSNIESSVAALSEPLWLYMSPVCTTMHKGTCLLSK